MRAQLVFGLATSGGRYTFAVPETTQPGDVFDDGAQWLTVVELGSGNYDGPVRSLSRRVSRERVEQALAEQRALEGVAAFGWSYGDTLSVPCYCGGGTVLLTVVELTRGGGRPKRAEGVCDGCGVRYSGGYSSADAWRYEVARADSRNLSSTSS